MHCSKVPTAEAGAAGPKPSPNLRLSGWRRGSLMAASVAWIVFILNISIFIWMWSSSPIQNGNGVAFRGSCKTSNTLDIFIHLLINILSTCLLGASNYCMQCLNAPTRGQINKAHPKGEWVDIGVPSLRNLRFMTKSKVLIWSLFALSSIPLHLLYNSVIFKTSQANQYSVALISQDFLAGAPWASPCNTNEYQQEPSYIHESVSACQADFERFVQSLLERVQLNSSSFQNLTTSDCIKAYNTNFETGRGDVVAVSTAYNASNSLLWSQYPYPYTDGGGTLMAYHNEWMCNYKSNNDSCLPSQNKASTWRIQDYPIDYCLSSLIDNQCELQFNVYILLIVAICNLVKGVLMTWMALRYDAPRLMTLGDALASFLDTPDSSTIDICMMPSEKIRRWCWKSPMQWRRPIPQKYTKKRDRWWRSVSKCQWWGSNVIFFLLFNGLLAGVCTVAVASELSPTESPLGAVNPLTVAIGVPGAADNTDSSLLNNILLANLPQIALSLTYLSFNNFLTSLSIIREWNGFSKAKKPLRVSQDASGSQISTRFLSLPTLDSAGLMIISALLHWLMSESLFIVHIDVLDPNGNSVLSDAGNSIGYSVLGLMILLVILGALNFLTLMLGWLRRFPPGMPVVGTCSAGISAACHPIGEGYISEKLVSWGEVSGRDHEGHCSFTSREVGMPVIGHVYGGQYCEQYLRPRVSILGKFEFEQSGEVSAHGGLADTKGFEDWRETTAIIIDDL